MCVLTKLNIFDPQKEKVPKSWISRNGGANPQAAIITDISKNVIKQSLEDYDKICITDLKSQINQEEDEYDDMGDVHLICELEEETDNIKKRNINNLF